jgi:hypothetical protein
MHEGSTSREEGKKKKEQNNDIHYNTDEAPKLYAM